MSDTRVRLSADERRTSILQHAKAVFAQLGYHQSGTRDIASACGISEATLYQHFRSKKQLFLAIFYHFGSQHHENWKQQVRDQMQLQGLRGLEQAFVVYRTLCATDPVLLQLLFQIFSETSDPDMAQAAQKYLHSIRTFLYELIEQAQAEKILSSTTNAEVATLQGMSIIVMMLVSRMVQNASNDSMLTDKHLVQLGQGWLRSCVELD
ncbi:MAG: hypothetical protein NVS2B12_17450 [Ktedonobacteraceae bacterium]